ncbi:MAG: outer-membrane lipoprotein carrier protein LolA [Candidatus Aminicenantes bacterium]|nr:outer-membrane lipoprotein carrier protein LolA [Candidatus Aminicenantes bacterium]
MDRRLLIIPGALLALAAALPAGDLLQRLRGRILEMRPFRVDFVQQVFVDEELTLEESGVIVFDGRERVKWQYLEPESKTFILEGDAYRFFDRENNQLLRGRLGARHEQLIWELLFADRPGASWSCDERRRTLRLRLDGEYGVQELAVTVGADFLPERAEQTAENEVTTVYLFRDYRGRVALADDEFALDLPADVEIIEERAP